MTIPSSIEALVGIWCHKDQDVEYAVSIQDDAICVTGLDTSDGEELHIHDISYNGSELFFTSVCPSTNFALTHKFRSEPSNEIEHEFTRIEKWSRKKTDES